MKIILDFPQQRRRVFTACDAVLATHDVAQVRDVLAAAELAARGGKWVIGFVTYEAAPAFDSHLKVRSPGSLPLAWFAVCDKPAPTEPRAAMQRASQTWSMRTTEAEFHHAVQHIRDEIAAGHTYQVNLTTRLHSVVDEPLELYEGMRHAQGTGYFAYIETDEFAIASASPELFFEQTERHLRTRPMKGTRPRGRWPGEDAGIARDLAASEKDRAENLMIVDLLRNDLGRIAAFGSVQVSALYDVETYRTVHQLTSTIECDLLPEVALVDVFAALFPCGSVTGAPKISTMGIIAELEAEPRGVYCGALGVIAPGGNATFNVPIRTVVVDRTDDGAVYGTGAGITFDSDAPAEYDEIIAKSAVLTEAWPEFELLETMRMENGRVIRSDRHLARLMESAAYFAYPVDKGEVRKTLRTVKRTDRGRVRLLVASDGTARLEALPIDEVSLPPVTLAKHAVSSTDRFLYHKTTNRAVYDNARIDGSWDVLLWNERDEITEFTRGNVVVEIDGERFTPPVQCGLLAGIYRGELLETRVISERIITKDEVLKASKVWFINSLREWIEVALR
ncbi:MAG TPA: aminodeoxychorismate synthase component I [Longimicrobiales bacterium]|nr:aminodeoxychorismate synthase component I [Longimicrobiales bacterium]